MNSAKLKLFVFDPVGNPGGGSRYIEQLLPVIKKARPEWDIHFFGNPSFFRREKNRQTFSAAGIHTKTMASKTLSSLEFAGRKWPGLLAAGAQWHLKKALSIFPSLISGDVSNEVRRISREADVAFFPWPYLFNHPETRCPQVATFHDFNTKYFFGTQVVHPETLHQLDRELPLWLQQAWPVVSSEFMRQELLKWHGPPAHPPTVIRLAPLVTVSPVPDVEADEVVSSLRIGKPFLLYPCHLCSHKNIQNLGLAIHHLSLRGIQVNLVLTGENTQVCTGRAGPVGIERSGLPGANIFGLGYVSNRTMNALLQKALAVISPSLYEAGNGPGIDGWARGTPVLMSDIPCYRENLEWFGVKAGLFDPTHPASIANAIEKLIMNPQPARHDAELSRIAVRQFSWENVGGEYARVIMEAASAPR